MMSESTHPNVRKLAFFVLDYAAVRSAVDEVYETATRIDIFVSNAGLLCKGKFNYCVLYYAIW